MKLRYDVSLHVKFAASLEREPISTSIVVGPETLLVSLEDTVRERADIPWEEKLNEIDFQELSLKVVSDRSCYRPYADGLDINIDEPLVEYFKRYRAEHRFLEREAGHSHSDIVHEQRSDEQSGKEWTESAIHAGPACLKFRRTLRVPDNVDESTLPPGLGTFPLVDVERFSSTVPASVKARGGYLMPMFQREALWIDFRDSRACAVKVSVGEVNALTGDHRSKDAPSKIQDYVTLPLQPWLDGIYTSTGVVRQFVAMKLGESYTVEEQVMGRATHGGIQLDVFPSIEGYLRCLSSAGKELDITKSPRRLRLAEGDLIRMQPSNLPPCLTVEDYATRVCTDLSFHFTCGDVARSRRTRSVPEQSYVHGLPDDDEPSVMGLAAGGQIKQKIYKDPRPTIVYDDQAVERVYIHTVSTSMWEKITGVVAPLTPIVPEMYEMLKYPWLDTFDEHLSSIDSTDGFQHVRAVGKVKTQSRKRAFVAADSMSPSSTGSPALLIDPDHPPQCSMHATTTADFVLRPCGHLACEACVGKIILRGKRCTSCGASASQFVGFKKPVPNLDGGGEAEWNIDETEPAELDPEPRNATVTTYLLDHDRVAPLAGVVFR